jgi:hypothetical protein
MNSAVVGISRIWRLEINAGARQTGAVCRGEGGKAERGEEGSRVGVWGEGSR